MTLSDTTPTVKALWDQLEREMTGEQRILKALEASLLARELAKSRIRTTHPDWSEPQVAREVLRLQFLPKMLPAGFR